MPEQSDAPEVFSGERSVSKILTGFGICILGASVGSWIYSENHDEAPAIYHHFDGTFSLNQKNGPTTSPSEVSRYLMRYEAFGTIRLVGHSNTLLQDWRSMFDECAQAGAPWYQFEIDGLVYRFHLPIALSESEDSPAPEIINLTSAEYPDTKDSLPLTEIAIVADEFTTCGELISAAAPHAERGKSVAVVGKNLLLRHSKGEKFLGREAFRQRRSEFWMQNVQPVIDWANEVFSHAFSRPSVLFCPGGFGCFRLSLTESHGASGSGKKQEIL